VVRSVVSHSHEQLAQHLLIQKNVDPESNLWSQLKTNASNNKELKQAKGKKVAKVQNLNPISKAARTNIKGLQTSA